MPQAGRYADKGKFIRVNRVFLGDFYKIPHNKAEGKMKNGKIFE